MMYVSMYVFLALYFIAVLFAFLVTARMADRGYPNFIAAISGLIMALVLEMVITVVLANVFQAEMATFINEDLPAIYSDVLSMVTMQNAPAIDAIKDAAQGAVEAVKDTAQEATDAITPETSETTTEIEGSN